MKRINNFVLWMFFIIYEEIIFSISVFNSIKSSGYIILLSAMFAVILNLLTSIKRKISIVLSYIFTIIIIGLIIAIGVLVYMKLNNKDEKIEEITPLEEMTEEQERETMISLYFINQETSTLAPEARKIDVKELIKDPYKMLIDLLIEGPKNEKLVKGIPEGTRVNNAVLKNGTVELDLSKEFIDNQKGETRQIELCIYSIVNTLTELNEVNFVKILIDGEENKKIGDIDLNQEFARQD